MSVAITALSAALPEDRWLDATEAGRYLGYSPWSIRKFAQRKLIKHVRAAGHSSGYRFRRQWLDEFMESRAVEVKTLATVLAGRQAVKPRIAPATVPMDPDLAKAVEQARARKAKQQRDRD